VSHLDLRVDENNRNSIPGASVLDNNKNGVEMKKNGELSRIGRTKTKIRR
jgi:hypothetical protein